MSNKQIATQSRGFRPQYSAAMPVPAYGSALVAQSQGTSLKELVIWSIVGVSAAAVLIYFGKKSIDKNIADKAQAKSFEDGTPETTAKLIKMAFENDGYWGTDMPALRAALTQIKSKAEMASVFKAYKKQYRSNLNADMQSELQSSQYNEVLQIMAAKPEKAGQAPNSSVLEAWAKRLKAAFDKTYAFMPGTDEAAIKAVFNEIPTQAIYVKVAQAFQRLYGQNLTTALKSELEFWEYPDYMKIITAKPKA